MKRALFCIVSCSAYLAIIVPASAQTGVFTLPLHVGSGGVQVTALQEKLTADGYYAGPITGYFGPRTEAAVAFYQMKHGLSPVGSVGPQTRALLNRSNTVAVGPLLPTTGGAVADTSTAATTTTATSANATTSTSTLGLPYRAPSFNGWIGTWGSVSTTSLNTTLAVKANASTTGADAMLPASSGWKNYRYTASLNVSNGDVSLFARYVDPDNFALCNFSGNQVSIEERLNGVTKTVASVSVQGISPDQYFQKSTSVSLRAQGRTIGCTALGGQDNVTYANLDPKLSAGGIGIETWQQGKGAATLSLTGVEVDPL